MALTFGPKVCSIRALGNAFDADHTFLNEVLEFDSKKLE